MRREVKYLIDAINELIRFQYNDRIVRSADSQIRAGTPVFSTSATDATGLIPDNVLQGALGFALNGAAPGYDFYILRDGDLKITIAGLDPTDLGPLRQGEQVLIWNEPGYDEPRIVRDSYYYREQARYQSSIQNRVYKPPPPQLGSSRIFIGNFPRLPKALTVGEVIEQDIDLSGLTDEQITEIYETEVVDIFDAPEVFEEKYGIEIPIRVQYETPVPGETDEERMDRENRNYQKSLVVPDEQRDLYGFGSQSAQDEARAVLERINWQQRGGDYTSSNAYWGQGVDEFFDDVNQNLADKHQGTVFQWALQNIDFESPFEFVDRVRKSQQESGNMKDWQKNQEEQQQQNYWNRLRSAGSQVGSWLRKDD